MPNDHIYQPLDASNHEIRLLDILPRDFFPGRADGIYCILRTVGLDEYEGKYNALSYTWGEQVSATPIYLCIDGEAVPFTVQESLYQALLHLRQDEKRVLVLWADAVCINQGDDVEKTSQVQQMKLVYARAASVMVWLGVEADGSAGVMEQFGQLGVRAREIDVQGGDKWPIMVSELKSRADEQATFPLQSTLTFLARPWWSRIWVVQEVASASIVRFHCGHQIISEHAMYHSVLLFTFARDAAVRRTGAERSEYEERLALSVEDNRPVCIVKELPFLRSGYISTAPGLMKRLRDWYMSDPVSNMTMKATDPRDLIFALLSICRDTGELGLAADYAKAKREVFVETARALLRYGGMEILSLAQGSRCENHVDLPTWVPDWSAPIFNTLQGEPWGSASRLADDIVVRGPRPSASDLRPYAASQGMASGFGVTRVSESVTTLMVSAMILDEVRETTTPWDRDAERYKDLVAFVERMYQLVEGSSMTSNQKPSISARLSRLYSRARSKSTPKSSNTKYADVQEAIFRTLVLDQENIHATGSVIFCRARPSFLSPAQSMFNSWTKRYSHKPPESFIRKLNDDAGFHHYNISMNTLATGRLPFVTEQGWIGMGPVGMRRGDVVVVIGGAAVPFVLRVDEQGRHQLVGEAYVHGIMDGEAVGMGGEVVDIELY